MTFLYGKRKWGTMLAVLLLLCMVGAVSADDYVGGIPLTTVQTDTVTGDLWFDAAPAPNWGEKVVTKTFYLPAEAVAEPGRITWARLYISAYCGHMQNDYAFTITNSFDGDGISGYEQVWPETGHAPFRYVLDDDWNALGNDNSAFEGHGTGEPYKMISDHENRVTSDYFMWYDVTDLISSETVNVNVNTTGSYDGRIKVITLVVAYDDPDSTTETTYWVNEGHDSCSYYTEDNFGYAAVGTTDFSTGDLSGLSGDITSALLTVDYMASNNGYYGFPTAENDFVYTGGLPPDPPVEGTFTNAELDRDPDVQGAYSGVDSWDVTSSIDGSSDVTFAYARYFPGTGTAAFFKIPLAFLEVKSAPSVEAPVAAFTANVTSGNSPLTVNFTDLSTGAPTGWYWDFDNDGIVDSNDENPSYTYDVAGYYTVNLTVSNSGGTDSEVAEDYITATCDLYMQGIPNPVGSTVFALEPNTLKLLSIRETGQGNAPSFAINVTASDGWSGTVTVPALNKSEIVSLSIEDPTIRTEVGGTVTYTAVLDPDGLVPETNEGNNQKTATRSVKFNGYKGSQYWTGKEEITTYLTYDMQGNFTHSFGNSSYRSGSFGSGWTQYTVGWTADNITVPDGATVVDARLYVPYCWDYEDEVALGTTATAFNGVNLTPEHWEKDTSNFGSYADYRYGLLTYNVTDLYLENELNTATFYRTLSTGKLSPAGFTLLVVYEDLSEPRKQIFINEGFDLLGASTSDYATTEEEATAFIEFTGMTIDMDTAVKANLTTFVPWGSPQDSVRLGEGNLYVNGVQIATDVWSYGERVVGESGDPQVAVDTRDVLDYLNPSGTGNVIGVQSTDGASPCMVAERSILVVEYPAEAPVADFEADPISGTAPLTVQFTDLSTNDPTEWAWDFGDEDTTNATMQHPVHTYPSPGTYTVTLNATNSGGSDEEVKTDYITVTAPPAPEAAFTASPLVGVAPLSVTFTDQSANGPTSWTWEYNAGEGWVEFSNETSPTFSFENAGPYDIRLTVSNAGGSDDRTYSHYVSVATGREPLTTVRNGTVSGDLYVNSTTTWPETEVTKTFALPDAAVGEIEWARLYVNTYSGSAQNSYALTSTVKFDGNDDGDYDDEGETLGVETMDIASETNGNSYPLNDHVTKVFSDYEARYDVTGLITAENPTAYVISEAISGSTFDGRIKAVTLVVAYNDGDADTVYYWVNHGQDWSSPGSGETVFDTTGLADGWVGAEIKIRQISSSDATTYTFNGVSKTGSGSTPHYDGLNTWNVTDDISAGVSSTLAYSSTTDSFKTPLATLKVRYEELIADFSATPLSGDAPLEVNFTDESTGSITGWAWDFGDDGSSEDRNPTHEYENAGTYTVSLTVTGPGGSDEEEKTDYITVTEPAPEIDFTGTPTSGAAPLTVAFTATNTGGEVDSWEWDFGDGSEHSYDRNATHVYESEGTYTVNLTATGPDYSDTESRENYISVGTAVIEVTITPASIEFGTMEAGIDETGNSTVNVAVTGGTAWSVSAEASNGGYMGTGSANLASAFQLSNDGTGYQDMTSAFADFLTGTAGNDGSGTADVRQSIDSADPAGDYAIIITFTGGFL